MPPFAAETYRDWFRKRARRKAKPAPARGKVILWADTFNNYFEPEVAASACEVLEEAGYEVLLPRRPLCCGRPLYDYGMLDLARRQLRQVLSTLREEIRNGTPVVGLEPSCISVFKDELTNLLDGDEDAARLQKQVFMLEEFLQRDGSGYAPPRLEAKALIHGHCHQKAVLGMESQRKMLDAMGVAYEEPDAGCCGLAGSFGFEAEKHPVSMKIGELKLLPALRKQPVGMVNMSNGFSCRHQMRMVPGKKPVHLAQMLHRAARGEAAQQRLEAGFSGARERARLRFYAMLGATALGLAAYAAYAFSGGRRRK